MTTLRSELMAVLAALLDLSETSRMVALDAVGRALGALSVSTDEIDALLSALEAHGRTVESPAGGASEQHLRRVVIAARELKQKSARRPTVAEVGAHAGLSRDQVLLALALLRIMQR